MKASILSAGLLAASLPVAAHAQPSAPARVLASEPVEPPTTYRSLGMRTTGMVFTFLSVAGFSTGIAGAVVDRHRDARTPYVGAVMVITGFSSAGVFAVAGASLWAVGAQPVAADGTLLPQPRLERAGIVLTSIGGASALAGVVAAVVWITQSNRALSDHSGGPGGGAGVASGLLLASGATLAGIGIPLWLVGANGKPAGPAAVPSVSIGPRGAALRWTF